MAQELSISVRIVQTQLERLYRKLGVSSRLRRGHPRVHLLPQSLLNSSADPQDAAAADLNGDGKSDGNDIQILIDILLGM